DPARRGRAGQEPVVVDQRRACRRRLRPPGRNLAANFAAGRGQRANLGQAQHAGTRPELPEERRAGVITAGADSRQPRSKTSPDLGAARYHPEALNPESLLKILYNIYSSNWTGRSRAGFFRTRHEESPNSAEQCAR